MTMLVSLVKVLHGLVTCSLTLYVPGKLNLTLGDTLEAEVPLVNTKAAPTAGSLQPPWLSVVLRDHVYVGAPHGWAMRLVRFWN